LLFLLLLLLLLFLTVILAVDSTPTFVAVGIPGLDLALLLARGAPQRRNWWIFGGGFSPVG